MKIGEAIQRVQSLYSKGVQSDDSKLYPGHIYSKLLSVRALLIFQKSNKKQSISPWNYQTLSCVELTKVDPSECPCVPEQGCKVVRTRYSLPEAINNMEGFLLGSVTSIEGSIEFSKSSWEEQRYKKGRKYTSNKPEYYIKDNYLFLNIKESMPGIIAITGLFRDPIEAAQYPGLCEECTDCEECDSFYDMEFPLDSDLEEPLFQIASQELVQMFIQIPNDTFNNSADDTTLSQQK